MSSLNLLNKRNIMQLKKEMKLGDKMKSKDKKNLRKSMIGVLKSYLYLVKQ